MLVFSNLWAQLEQTDSLDSKRILLVDYFGQASAQDAIWAIALLTGKKPKRIVSSKQLADAFLQETGIPTWIFLESNHIVGDTAETIALLNDTAQHGWNCLDESKKRACIPTVDTGIQPEPVTKQYFNSPTESIQAHFLLDPEHQSLWSWLEEKIKALQSVPQAERHSLFSYWWQNLEQSQVLLLNRLLTGTLRSPTLLSTLAQALSETFGVEAEIIKHRLMQDWKPTEAAYKELLANDLEFKEAAEPFALEQPISLVQPIETLGSISNWWLELRQTGIRVQCIYRSGQVFLWSSAGELLTDRFPELREFASLLPDDTVLEGIISGWKNDQFLPLAQLEERIAQKSITAKTIAKTPVAFLTVDLLQYQGQDIRQFPLENRKSLLNSLVSKIGQPLFNTPRIMANHWEDVKSHYHVLRQNHATAIILRHKNSQYGASSTEATCWTWEAQPYVIKTVLMYIKNDTSHANQRITEYTFGVWHERQLLPVARTGLGLSEAETEQLKTWVSQNTDERFGPVRSVPPAQVFQLVFDGITESRRHKAGLVLGTPRILSWNSSESVEEAATLDDLYKLLNPIQATHPEVIQSRPS